MIWSTVHLQAVMWSTRMTESHAAPAPSEFPSLLERVAHDHQGTLFGHYDIECLLKTSQATPLAMWGSLRDSQTNIVAAN